MKDPDNQSSLRHSVCAYALEKYHTTPEFLWKEYPSYAVLRRAVNRKWYGLIMDVPENRLGVASDKIVDILNVKLAETSSLLAILAEPGFFKGYHMSGRWISILLDGTVSFSEICRFLDESFEAASPRKRKRSSAGNSAKENAPEN